MLPTRFEIQTQLASSERSIVFRCLDLASGAEVMVKRDLVPLMVGDIWLGDIQTALWSSDAARSLRSQEALALATLQGRMAPVLVDHGMWQGHEYVVAAWLEAEPIEVWLARQVAPDALVVAASKLARGLADIHQLGVVHRDIKPSNVLMCGDEPRLVDWEVASVGRTHVSGRVGTRGYRDGATDHRADLFAFGALLYALATGKSPAHTPGFGRVVAPVFGPEVPGGVADAVRWLTHACPEARPSSANEVIALLSGARRDVAYSDPGIAGALAWSARWLEADAPEEALVVLAPLLVESPVAPAAAIAAAWALAASGHEQRAIDSLRAVLQREPAHREATRALCTILLNTERTLEALACAWSIVGPEGLREIVAVTSMRVTVDPTPSDLSALAVAAVRIGLSATRDESERLLRLALNALATLMTSGPLPGPLATTAWVVALSELGRHEGARELATSLYDRAGFERARRLLGLERRHLLIGPTAHLLALIDLGEPERARDIALEHLRSGPHPTVDAWLDVVRVAALTDLLSLEMELSPPTHVRLDSRFRRIDELTR